MLTTQPNLVMLVDDEADQRTTTRLLLMAEGVEVIEAESGEAALERLQTQLPALILLDFNMEGLDGVETLAKIRERYSDRELPVLMLSGRQESEIIVSALDNGANDYITKLTDPAVLMARVRRHLHRSTLKVNQAPKLGSYILGPVLGEGGAATVYRLDDPSFEQQVAVKVLKPGFSLRPDLEEPIARVDHPAISATLQCGTDPVDHLITQYVEGRSLDVILADGPVGDGKAIDLILRLTEPLQEIHAAGNVHGDLRPSNVKVDEGERPIILDFGVSGLIHQENEVSASDFFYGHPAFQAPEQLRGSGELDARADLYSLGAIMFSLLTGGAAFDGPLSQIPFKVLEQDPPKISSVRGDGEFMFDFVIHKLLNKDPDARYQSIEEVQQKLRELGEELV